MKKWIYATLILALAQLACNLPRTTPAATPLGLPATENTSAPLPTGFIPTYTPALPATETSTPAPILTDTPQPSPTITFTPDPAQMFTNLKISVPGISAFCAPKDTTIEITTTDQKVHSILVYARLLGKTKGEKTAWNSGYQMTPLGDGNFTLKLKATTLPNYKDFTLAWVQFQFVATGIDNAIITRSQVYTDKLTYSHDCP